MKLWSLVPVAALTAVTPAAAEVVRTTDDSFVSRHEVVVEASPKEVWLALITPAGWWRADHTWSGDAKNLTLMPQAGGCFCETIPEVDEPGRFTLEGSVEHMRVVQAYPESALRMVGALGPLQSEPVTGVLTIAISTVPKGTRVVWEYNVGGPMRYEVPVISKAVDGVMGLQLAALAKPLRVVPMPPPAPPTDAPIKAPTAESAPPPPSKPGEGGAKLAPGLAPAPAPAAKPAAVPASKPAVAPVPKPSAPASTAVPPPKPAPQPAPKPSAVDEAFGDLTDRKPG